MCIKIVTMYIQFCMQCNIFYQEPRCTITVTPNWISFLWWDAVVLSSLIDKLNDGHVDTRKMWPTADHSRLYKSGLCIHYMEKYLHTYSPVQLSVPMYVKSRKCSKLHKLSTWYMNDYFWTLVSTKVFTMVSLRQ